MKFNFATALSGTVVKIGLLFLMLLGIALGVMEVIHLRDKAHVFSWWPFGISAVLVIFPALFFDTTGRVRAALTFFGNEASAVRLGRRETDPIVPVVPVPAVSTLLAPPPFPIDKPIIPKPPVIITKDENAGLG